jgi:hypothetical protein
MKLTTAHALWCGAALVLIGGTFGVVTLGERRIADQTATNEDLAAQLTANNVTVRSRGSLLAERARLRSDLRRLGTAGESTPIVARFVRDAARVAQEHHTTIASIAAPGSLGAPKDRFEPLDAIPLAVTVEGRYGDVLAVTRALSALPVPAEIDVLSVIRTTQPGPVTVAAALHVVLQRVGSRATSDVGARSD